MNDHLNDKLYNVTAMAFEEMAFVFQSPELAEKYAGHAVEAVASVKFEGPFKGKLVLKAYQGLSRVIAANMLGEDEPSERQQYDALGEMANIICGNMLPSIADKQDIFHLNAPQIIREQPAADFNLDQPLAEAHIPFSDGKVDVLFFTDAECN